MTYGLSSDAKQIIDALKSERDRLKGNLKERTEERDRARRIAVDLEQQTARVVDLHQQEDYLINTVIMPPTKHHGCFTCKSDGPCATSLAVTVQEVAS